MKYLLETKKLSGLIIGLLFCLPAWAGSMQGIPPRPQPPKLVNNLSSSTDFITEEQTQALETKLVAFANETSNQIVIVIVDSLNGYDASEYATELGHEWKVGQKKFDNGIVILVKLSLPHQIFIAPGYGLEGAIPDATCEQIVQNEILPQFEQHNYYLGLDKATDVLIGLAKGEYNSQDYKKKSNQGSKSTGFLIAIIIFVIVFIISRRGGGKGGFTLGNAGLFFWGSSLFGGGGGFGGGGFGGGGGGGGFGGFGGGDFGGGGAGGSW